MKYEINGITSGPHQTFNIDVPETSEKLYLELRYFPTQMMWCLSFQYKNIKENGIKLVLSPNILRNYRNIIPFGLSVYADGTIYPLSIDDFETGRVKLYILPEIYVANLEECLYNG